jgi:hypothetical protein
MIFTPKVTFGFPVYNLNTAEASAILNSLPASILMAHIRKGSQCPSRTTLNTNSPTV